MKSVLTVFMCFSFSFFTIGCYSLQPENISANRTIVTDGPVQLKMKNGELLKWAEGRIDSVRVDTSDMAVFKNGSTLPGTYPVDSVKTLYVTKFNGFRTVTTSVFVLTIVVPSMLFFAFVGKIG